jgi:hypothetical protein
MVSETPELDEPTELADAEPPAATAWHTDRNFPVRVGEIQIDEQGRIRPRDSAVPLNLGFAYRGIQYHAEVETTSEPRVRLTADLGKLPYSMEIGAGRHLIRCILNSSARAYYGRINLSQDQDIFLEAELTPPEPFTPASLMATLTALLLDFQPYLDLLGRVLTESQRPKAASTLDPAG